VGSKEIKQEKNTRKGSKTKQETQNNKLKEGKFHPRTGHERLKGE
jgi:hypothetical protein